jgi:hypothetical protein
MAFAKWNITPHRNHIDTIVNDCIRIGGTLLLPDGWKFRPGRDYFAFEKKVPVITYPVKIPGSYSIVELPLHLSISIETSLPENLNKGKWTIFLDGDNIGESCRFRSITSNDVFMPFGSDREERIFHFLAKQGMALVERERTCGIFTSDNKAVWIAGIRLDERFRIHPSTRSVIKFKAESFL